MSDVKIVTEGLGTVFKVIGEWFHRYAPKDPDLKKIEEKLNDDELRCRTKYEPEVDKETTRHRQTPEGKWEIITVKEYKENPKYVKCVLESRLRFCQRTLEVIERKGAEQVCRGNIKKEKCILWVKKHLPSLKREIKSLESQLRKLPTTEHEVEVDITDVGRVLESSGGKNRMPNKYLNWLKSLQEQEFQEKDFSEAEKKAEEASKEAEKKAEEAEKELEKPVESPGKGEVKVERKDTKKGKTARLPDGSGFFVGTVGSKKVKENILPFYLDFVQEVSPPEWEGTVKKMKKHKEIKTPWALAWYMKKKGAKPHYTKAGKKKAEYKEKPGPKKKK